MEGCISVSKDQQFAMFCSLSKQNSAAFHDPPITEMYRNVREFLQIFPCTATGCHKRSQDVTRCHKMSQDVTRCHRMSQDVTRCHKMSQGNQFQQQFEVDFCILAGCDYLPTISKVRMLQNACDVIRNQARVRWIHWISHWNVIIGFSV